MWLRRLSTDRIERRLSAPADGPRVVVASIKGAQQITALNDAAARLGLKAGLGLADARARYPSLPVVEADSEADLTATRRLSLAAREGLSDRVSGLGLLIRHRATAEPSAAATRSCHH